MTPLRLCLFCVLPALTASCRFYPGETPASLTCSALKLLWLNHLWRTFWFSTVLGGMGGIASPPPSYTCIARQPRRNLAGVSP